MKTVSLQTNTPELFSEICDEIRLFIPVKRVEQVENAVNEGYFLLHSFCEQDFSHAISLYNEGELISEGQCKTDKPDIEDLLLYKKLKKRGAKKAAFSCLMDYFKKDMPWGSLTGIRPTKLYRETAGDKDAFMRDEFGVSEEKISLLRQMYGIQAPFIDSVTDKDIDIYIGIPFCTTRCAYCSFVSSLTSKNGQKEADYVTALLKEIELCEDILKNYNIRSVYIGGGTPTSLCDYQLERVLERAGELAKGTLEFTVEAGRPDTITKSKLELITKYGATRVSVNAQTANDETLKLIGRSHSYADFEQAFKLVKESGLIINTDLIAGLPNETVEDTLNSVGKMIELAPQNITLHTLAIKNASRFAEENMRGFMSAQDAARAVSMARELLYDNGYLPYYMYRQKYMAGNMENVGYSLSGSEGVYNIDIMEETTSILAFGAGGMSKRVFDKGRRIERTPAVKDILNYLTRTEEMAMRKHELFNN